MFKCSAPHGFLILTALLTAFLMMQPGAFFTDETPPVMTIEGQDGGSFAGPDMSLRIVARDRDSSLGDIRFYLDGKQVLREELHSEELDRNFSFDISALTEGEHRLEVSLRDGAFLQNREEKDFSFFVDRTYPVVTLVRDLRAVRGEVLVVHVRCPEREAALRGEIFGISFPFYSVEGEPELYAALKGISAIGKKGDYPLKVTAVDGAGLEAQFSFTAKITQGEYLRESIEIPQERAALLTDKKAMVLDRQKLAAAFKVTGEKALWEGLFVRPVRGIVSSPFGTRRIYNNGLIASYHKGLDLANFKGTPVKAANYGKVVLAEFIPVHGNTVVLDHGRGIFSMYNHMDQIETAVGRMVKKEELLGTLGNTGLSTGPHLHWEIRAGGVPVSPGQWEREVF